MGEAPGGGGSGVCAQAGGAAGAGGGGGSGVCAQAGGAAGAGGGGGSGVCAQAGGAAGAGGMAGAAGGMSAAAGEGGGGGGGTAAGSSAPHEAQNLPCISIWFPQFGQIMAVLRSRAAGESGPLRCGGLRRFRADDSDRRSVLHGHSAHPRGSSFAR